MTTQNLITRDFHGVTIRQRSDGYLCATDMCQANGKLFTGYKRLKSTKSFLVQLSDFLDKNPVMLISITEQNQELIQTVQGGNPEEQGTWIHPYVAINLAQWCSSVFAVLVTNWIYELLTTNSVSLNPEQSKQKSAQLIQAKSNELDRMKIVGNAKRIALNNFIKEQLDCDILAMFEMESQPAEIQQTLLIPSIIAKQTGLQGPRQVNVKLIELGLQTKHYDHRNKIYYQLTEKGLKYGQYQDFTTGKISGRKIKWYENVLELFPLALTSVPKQAPQSNLQLF